MRKALCRYQRLGLCKTTLSSLDVAARIRGCIPRTEDANAVFAVYEAFCCLRTLGDEETIRAVKAVYLTEPWHHLPAKEISRRVLHFSIEHHCDERTVWRRLHRFVSLYEGFQRL